MSTETLAAILGWIGTAIAISWPLFRSRTGMLWAQTGVSVLFTGHYFLIDAVTGSILNFLSGVQAAAAIPLGQKPAFRWLYLATVPVIATVMALTWGGLASAAAAAGMTLVSFARWQLDPAKFRLIIAGSVPLWFTHNYLVGSWPGMIADSSAAILLARAIWLDRRSPKDLAANRPSE